MKPSSIRTALPRLLAKQRPVFLWGAPGVGKSDVVRQIADDHKYELRDVRLSLLDPVDLKGFPTVDTVKKQMKWLPADFLPTKGKGLLFLDEMNSAPQSVQAAAYQLVLNRKIGEYKLPDGWAILAAGNRASDRSVVHAMPAALANRFVHLDFDVSNEDWDKWALNEDIHTDIRSFLRFRSNLLHSFDSSANPRAFPSPRSWSFVNDIYKDSHDPSDEFELIKGTVGEGAAGEFLAFTRQIKDLPSVDQVLLDPDGTAVPANPSAQYAMVTALEKKTTTNNIGRLMKYIERLPTEYQVVFVRNVAKENKAIATTKSYMDWVLKNQEVLM